MELQSLTLSEFKRFSHSLTIDHLTSGLNLFVGPNEAGKSTVVAAIRSAFFERYRSSKLEHLQPWQQGNTAPTVDIRFTHDGKQYRLLKSFMAKKRCVLTIDGITHEGDDAEQRLESLLGFTYAAKGNSKPAQQGIPGLLWIQQGEAQDITAPVSHASDRIRGVLESMVGEVSSSSGDQLIQQVEHLRNELVTPSTRKPRGEYAQALSEKAAISDKVAALRAQITAYESYVDELTGLHNDIRKDEQEDRQGQLTRQLNDAEKKLADVQRQQKELDEQHQQLAQRKQRHSEVIEQLLAHDNDVREQQQRQQALEEKQITLKEQHAARIKLEEHVHALKEDLKKQRHVLASARNKERWQSLRQQHVQTKQQISQLENRISAAEKAQKALKTLEARLYKVAIDAKAVDQLESAQQQLTHLTIQLNSKAPLLTYRLNEGKTLTLGNTTLDGAGQYRLLDTETLVMPDIGEITLTPGNNDLDSLVEQKQAQEAQVSSLLEALGVTSLEDAKKRLDEYRELDREAFHARTRWEAQAPEGLDTLKTARLQLQQEADTLQQQLSAIDTSGFDASLFETAPSDLTKSRETENTANHFEGAVIDIRTLEQEEASLKTRLDEKNTLLHQAQVALEGTTATVQILKAELKRAHQKLASEERVARQRELSTASVSLKAEITTYEKHMATLQTELKGVIPSLLEQDVQRLDRSLQHFLHAQQDRKNRQIKLETLLENLGAQGLEEQVAHLVPKQAQVSQRCEEFTRREAALTLLLDKLRNRRQQLIQQLQAPLLEKINHYLRLLFPDAHLTLDEQLIPQTLRRLHGQSESAGDIEQLSFGAREQLGVISRLAYADLLKASGHPTLLILDDALVNADSERLTQMKRILYDASSRHQLLIFSCHPAYWGDLGVEARTMASLTRCEEKI